MNALKFATVQAECTEPIISAIFNHLAAKLRTPITAVHDIPWQQRYRQIEDGRLDIAWICSSYYTHLADQPDPIIELLVAPIMKQARYQGEPVYFSDVIVRKDSPFQAFADLRGASFAYNEPGSFSGYWAMRHHLSEKGALDGYFGRLIESGSHVNSIQMILDGEVDTAAIDSTVMSAELQENPDLAAKIRVVETLGPNPIPPWVVRRDLPKAQKAQLRRALLTLHEDEDGRTLLQTNQLRGFTAVTDAYYNASRQMMAKAAEVAWQV